MDEAQSYQCFITVWDYFGVRTVSCDGMPMVRQLPIDTVFRGSEQRLGNTAGSSFGMHRGLCAQGSCLPHVLMQIHDVASGLQYCE